MTLPLFAASSRAEGAKAPLGLIASPGIDDARTDAFGEGWGRWTSTATRPLPMRVCSSSAGIASQHLVHARTYVPMLGRFTRPDPANSFSLFNPQSLNRYAYAHNNPVNLIDPDGKDAIPVVFPDYRVALPTGGRYPFGHAGIILIDNKTGSTRYYEYGRYSPRGSVRQVGVPDVKMGADGFPTKESLKRLFNAVRKESGQGGRLEGAYVKDDNFAAMVEYAEGREAQNEDPSRKKYGFLTNNCMTFAQDVLESGGMNTPLMIDPSPKSYIKELQESASDKGTTGDGVARVVKVCDNNGCHFAIR